MAHPKKISSAISHILFSQEFFGKIIPRTPIIRDNSIPTACTNGIEIRYNSDFMDRFDIYSIAGAFIHEILHIIMLHAVRHGNRDLKLWGISCDYAINLIIDDLSKTSQIKLPKDKDFQPYSDTKYRNMSAEEIYDELVKNPNKVKQLKQQQQKAFCGVIEEVPAEENKKALEQEVKSMVTYAANEAKRAGNLPGSLKQLLDPILKPKLPWREVLLEFMDRYCNSKLSWNRPNKRFPDIYLPTRVKTYSGDFVFSVDVSSSMSDQMVSMVLGQTRYVISTIRPKSVTLVQHDSTVKHPVKVYEQGEDFPTRVPILGRGGTNFIPVFDFINSSVDPLPSCVVMLTDSEGRFPTEPPPYPVLWVIVDRPLVTMPWGQTVHVSSREELQRAA